MAKLKGASVMITDLNDERLAFAEKNGADVTVNAQKEDPVLRVNEWTKNEGANVVIDAVCLPSTFETSIDAVSPAGHVVVLGFDERTAGISQLPITKKEVTITGSRLQTNQFPCITDLLNKGLLTHGGLITHTFSADDVHQAFQLIEQHPARWEKQSLRLIKGGARMLPKYAIYEKLLHAQVVAVIRGQNSQEALEVSKAAISGGISAIELTYTTPEVEDVFKELRHQDILLGAGSVMDTETARHAILSGASFIVSSHFVKEIASLCNQYSVPYLPDA